MSNYISRRPKPDYPFSKLAHLHLAVDLTESTLCNFASILPAIHFIHFGTDQQSQSPLKYVDFKTLQSISLFRMNEGYLQPMFDTLLSDSHPCQLEKLFLGGMTGIMGLPEVLKALPLKGLHMIGLPLGALDSTFRCLDLSKLTPLNILHTHYDWSTETLLASRSNIFTEQFCMHLEKVSKAFEEFGVMIDIVERVKGGVYSDRFRPVQEAQILEPTQDHCINFIGVITASFQWVVLSSLTPNGFRSVFT
ncbi:hypothetical protein EC957_005897 [Mortierella hygrophila]|uniref:Uncharacterized protein n=1 Tax=Mortierella hygrophila TaxID=979708 RepID=A0A9P6FF37_9FUNG|nr:hypothetical protein EC957_005897 [Mortierella hygrophila]